MQRQRRAVEVLGVPDVLPANRIVDKLKVHFLQAKNGGGDVRQVLYPCGQPGQAFILFEDPKVAARVLQKSSHMLEVEHQQYRLTVKASAMDLPVEATLHLNHFQDETQVRQILTSHDFKVTDLGGGQVRVEGCFLMLKAVKVRLEQLAKAPPQPPRSSSPVPAASSGAVSKRGVYNIFRSKSLSKHESPPSPNTSSYYASGSSYDRPPSQENGASYSPDSARAGDESFIVDADVFKYADKVKKKNIDAILNRHNVSIDLEDSGESCRISLRGKNPRTAASELQRIFEELSKSLRTQEVPLVDMNWEGRALLGKIQKTSHIHNSVLVFEMRDRLHLIGPSSESYELKQKLLGRPVDQSGRRGRSLVKNSNSRSRSSSLPPIHQKPAGRGSSGAVADPSPGGAAGYSPSKYQDDKQEAAAVRPRSGSLNRRSHSEAREVKKAARDDGDTPDNHQPPKSAMKKLQQLLTFKHGHNNIKDALKKNKNRK